MNCEKHEPSSIVIVASPPACSRPLQGGYLVIPRKFPSGNRPIPRRADQHRIERMPTTVSYRSFVMVESRNLSSGHLYRTNKITRNPIITGSKDIIFQEGNMLA